MSENKQQIEITVPQKSIALAIVLTLLFGPLGLLYSTVLGAVIMTIITLLLFFVGGFLITWPICVIWAYIAVKKHNKKTIIENI